MNVLLVEDNPADARLVREAVSEATVAAVLTWAATGEAALDRLRDAAIPRPDLVLLDLNLPGTLGTEVLAAIKSDPRLLTIPVVVLSSSRARRDVADVYRLHANAYVAKPDGYDDALSLFAALGRFWMEAAVLPGDLR